MWDRSTPSSRGAHGARLGCLAVPCRSERAIKASVLSPRRVRAIGFGFVRALIMLPQLWEMRGSLCFA